MKRFLMLSMVLAFVIFASPAIAAVGWQDDFEPIKATWVETDATWTDVAGPTAILTENNPSGSYGVAASETITLDLDQYSELVITSVAIDVNANYSVQIQEIGGSGAYADAAQWVTQPGTQIVDIAALMGWFGTKSFVINVYIDGEGKSATFERLEIREPIGWVESFDPLKISWTHEETYWTDTAGQGATLTEDSVDLGVRWWGAAYAETITIDLDVYDTLYVDVNSVEAGCMYTIQIQEMEGVGATVDAIAYSVATGETVVNLKSLMGWSGVKTFRIAIWLDAGGGGRDVAFNEISVGSSLAYEGWLEDFDPIKPTWAHDETYWTDTPGPNAILTEDSADLGVRWWGAAYSEAITTDVNLYSLLYVKVSDVETGCMYTIQIEEIGGAAATADAISYAGEPGEHIIDIAALMSWSGVKTFRINIWLDAGDGGRNVTFNKIEIQSNQITERPNPIFWQDHFDPVKTTWNEMGAYWTDTPDSNAIITEGNPGISYGKIESETLTVNLDVYEELTVVVTDVELGGWLDVGVQEQGDPWAHVTINDAQITGPNTLKVNIPAETGWSGYKAFRVVLWINGNDKSATLDMVKVAADCGTDVLLGDYYEDCIVDLRDIAEIGLSWMDSYDTTDLSDIADNWLVEYY